MNETVENVTRRMSIGGKEDEIAVTIPLGYRIVADVAVNSFIHDSFVYAPYYSSQHVDFFCQFCGRGLAVDQSSEPSRSVPKCRVCVLRYGSQEARKIRRVDEVWICDQQVSDAKVREIVGDDRTDATGPDDADLGVF